MLIKPIFIADFRRQTSRSLRPHNRRTSGFCQLLFAAIAIVGFAQAQSPSGGVYVITKQAIASGGGFSSAGPYELVGTLGQANAGAASGGAYSAQIGFQTAPINQSDPLFSNGFEN